jgi:hypothetical protein
LIIKDKHVDIYRKPTTTDVIIPKDSCHAIEQKMAAIRYFKNRIHTYNLDPKDKQKEINTVQQIIQNNKYSTSTITKAKNNKTKHKKPQQDCLNIKWAKFTYTGRETRTITKLFKNTNIKIAHTTNNNLRKLLEPQIIAKSRSKSTETECIS